MADFTLRVWSAAARLEPREQPHSLHAPVDGRVVAVQMDLDQIVREGDLLVEFDSAKEKLLIRQEGALLEGWALELETLNAQVQAEQEGLEAATTIIDVAISEGKALQVDREAAARVAESQAARSDALRRSGHIGEQEQERDELLAVQRRAEAAVAEFTARRNELVERLGVKDRVARIADIQGEIAALQGQIMQSRLEISRLEESVADREVRAPIHGHVGAVAGVKPGTVLALGDSIGTIVPVGDLRVIAEFEADTALGLVQRGKKGDVRFDAFPWPTYGVVPVVVRTVATELRDDLVRVELDLVAGYHGPIPLQHGLTGVVSIEVEELSPASLVLRYAGSFDQRARAKKAAIEPASP